MTLEGLRAYAAGKGWKMAGNIAMTVWQDGFPVSIVRANYGYVTATVRCESTSEAKEAIKNLRKEWKGVCDFTKTNFSVTVSSRSRKDDAIEQVDQGLNALIAALREAGCAPPGKCPICKQEGCDSAALIQQGYVPVHEACVHQHRQSAAEKAEENMVTGNYFTGFLGALVGSFVGALPSLLSILLAERIYVILFALIPMGAYQGYKLLQGKMNRFAFVSSLICSVIGVFALNFAVFAVTATKMYGAIPIPYLVNVFFSNLGEILVDMIMDFVFLALGLFICYGRISRTAATETAGAMDMEASLLPLHEQERV